MKTKSTLSYMLLALGFIIFAGAWLLNSGQQAKASGLETHVVYLPMVLNNGNTQAVEPTQPTQPTPQPPTATPVAPTPPPTTEPSISATLVCDTSTSLMLTVHGENWSGSNISFYWNDVIQGQMHPPAHGSIQATYKHHAPTNGQHNVRVENDLATKELIFNIDCLETSEPAEPTPEPTPIPLPDLLVEQPKIISGDENLFNTAVTIGVTVTNKSDITLYNMIFIDLFINPNNVFEDSIPLTESDDFIMLTSLSAGETRFVTFTLDGGLPEDAQTIYVMIDTAQVIEESSEINNVSDPLTID